MTRAFSKKTMIASLSWNRRGAPEVSSHLNGPTATSPATRSSVVKTVSAVSQIAAQIEIRHTKTPALFLAFRCEPAIFHLLI
jgi:hypothetical protein